MLSPQFDANRQEFATPAVVALDAHSSQVENLFSKEMRISPGIWTVVPRERSQPRWHSSGRLITISWFRWRQRQETRLFSCCNEAIEQGSGSCLHELPHQWAAEFCLNEVMERCPTNLQARWNEFSMNSFRYVQSSISSHCLLDLEATTKVLSKLPTNTMWIKGRCIHGRLYSSKVIFGNGWPFWHEAMLTISQLNGLQSCLTLL